MAQACVDYLHLNARLPRHPHLDFRNAKVTSSIPVSGTRDTKKKPSFCCNAVQLSSVRPPQGS
jgi:hypothetical protein